MNFVEQLDDLGPARLQGVDHFHARDHPRLLFLEREDLLDRLVEFRDLGGQELVAALLRVDHRADHQVREQREQAREADRGTEAYQELFPTPLAERLPPGQ